MTDAAPDTSHSTCSSELQSPSLRIVLAAVPLAVVMILGFPMPTSAQDAEKGSGKMAAPGDEKTEDPADPGDTEDAEDEEEAETKGEAEAEEEAEAGREEGEETAEETEDDSAVDDEAPTEAAVPGDSGQDSQPEPRVEPHQDRERFKVDTYYIKNATFARLNPLGLVDSLEVGYKAFLYRDNSLLFKDSYFGVAVTPFITPAYLRLGGLVELQPLAVLKLSAKYERISYFGNFGILQSFPSPTREYDDETLDEFEELGANYSTSGSQLTLASRLQGKVGPVAARVNLQIIRPSADLFEGDRVWYDQLLDVTVSNDSWVYVVDSDLIYITNFGLNIGVRHNYTKVVYDDADFLEGESTSDPNSPTQRVGPLLAWKFSDWAGGTIKEPTVVVLANWWIQHRYRTGEVNNQALPYLAFGFVFNMELAPEYTYE